MHNQSDWHFLLVLLAAFAGGLCLLLIVAFVVLGLGMWLTGVPVECVFVRCFETAPGEITVVNK